MPELTSDIRVKAAEALQLAHRTYDNAALHPNDSARALAMTDAVLRVALPAHERQVKAEDESAEQARNRRLSERIAAGTATPRSIDEIAQFVRDHAGAHLDVPGPRAAQIADDRDQLKEQAEFWRARAVEVDAHRRLLVRSVNELISIRRGDGNMVDRLNREQAVWELLAELADWERYRPHSYAELPDDEGALVAEGETATEEKP